MPSYENETSAEARVREALMYRLGEIAVAGGYLNDVADVLDDFPDDPGSITSFPTLAVLTGYETRERFDNEMLYVDLKAVVLAFVEPDGYGSVTEAVESIKQDIHAVLGNHPGLPGSDDEPTCQLAVFSFSEPFGRVLDAPLAGSLRGVKIGIDVTWQQRFEDPTEN